MALIQVMEGKETCRPSSQGGLTLTHFESFGDKPRPMSFANAGTTKQKLGTW